MLATRFLPVLPTPTLVQYGKRGLARNCLGIRAIASNDSNCPADASVDNGLTKPVPVHERKAQAGTLFKYTLR